MRVTNSMMSNRMLTNISRNLNNLNKYNNQMSTGKKIQFASEDPLVASRALRYRTIVSDTEQYSSNVNQARSFAEVTESAVKNINSIVTTMSELMVKGASETNTSSDRLKIIKEYNSLLSQLENEMNTTYMGRYIFSGYKTDTPPVLVLPDGTKQLNELVYGPVQIDPTIPPDPNFPPQAVGPDLPINDQDLQIMIGVGTTISINSLGNNIYDRNDYKKLHIFDREQITIDGVDYASIEAFLSGPYNELTDAEKESADKQLGLTEKISTTIKGLEDFLSKVSNEHTSIGVKQNRLDLVETRLTDEKTSYKALMSENEDIDLTEASMNFNTANTAYSAALNVGMKINKISLVDYL